MDVLINNVGFAIDSKLEDFIHTKINKLNKYYNRIVSSSVYLKLENSGKIKDKVVEISLMVPNQKLVCKSDAPVFEAAVDECISGLEKQLKRYKAKYK